MNRYRKLFSNSIVFAIGNLGSKMITFFMVPLYTRYLTTAQYGQADVLTTMVSLLTPVLTLSIIDAVFRFALDKASDNTAVLTNGFVISLLSFVIFIPFSYITNNYHYITYLFILTYITAIQSMLQQFARGIGKSVVYAATGILMTITTVVSNIVFIVFLKRGLPGYLASLVIAQIIGILFLIIILQLWNYIDLKKVNRHLMTQMLIYSIPLIPNVVSWWLSNSANKIIISIMLGVSANGIYAVANKIPSLISVFYTIFTQAWQISAVEEFDKKDSSIFFSEVFAATLKILFIGVSFLVIAAKPMVLLLSTPDYYEAWKIVPWLSLAVLYSSASSFLGTVYTSSMRTGALFTTTIFGAVINIIGNMVFIPLFGVIGAGIGAALSFLLVTLIRLESSKKFISISVDWKNFLLSNGLILSEIVVIYMFPSILGSIIASILFSIIVIFNAAPFLVTIKNYLGRRK